MNIVLAAMLILVGANAVPNDAFNNVHFRNLMLKEPANAVLKPVETTGVVTKTELQKFHRVIETLINALIYDIVSNFDDPFSFDDVSKTCAISDHLIHHLSITGVKIIGMSATTFHVTATPTGLSVELYCPTIVLQIGKITKVRSFYNIPIETITSGTITFEGTKLILGITISKTTVSSVVANIEIGNPEPDLTCSVGGVDTGDTLNIFITTYFLQIWTNLLNEINATIGHHAFQIVENVLHVIHSLCEG